MKRVLKNNKGSLSLEAAIAVPFFLFAVLTIISIIQFYIVSMDTDMNIYCAAKELAMYGHAVNSLWENEDKNLIEDAINTGAVDLYVLNKFYGDTDRLYSSNVLQNDFSVLSFIFSSCKDDVIDVVGTYKIEPWGNIFNVPAWQLISRGRVKSWTGYAEQEMSSDSEERIVYITETGEVYHLSKSCTYLDLSIRSMNAEDIENSRNKSGGKYVPCKKCRPKEGVVVYVTDYGESYHGTLTCSSLKRSITEIYISQVGDRRCCKKCAGA